MEKVVEVDREVQRKSAQQSEIYFCPEGNVAEKVMRQSLSQEKKQAIRSLHTLDKRWNAVILLHFSLWLAAGYFAVSTDVMVLNLLCYVIAGLALSSLSVLTHESSHNLITRNSRIDRWIGFLCGAPILFSAAGYRIVHPIHHKHVRSSEDPDDLQNATTNPKLLLLFYALFLVFGVYLYLIVVPLHAFKKASRSQRFNILFETGIMVAVLAICWSNIRVDIMVEGWLLPLIVAGQIANIRGIAEHGMTSPGNEFIDTRTVKTNSILSFLMCNINYHLEHHLYPGIPWYHLPKLHGMLAEVYKSAGSSVYAGYGSFLMDFITALKTGVHFDARLIPQHVREEICL